MKICLYSPYIPKHFGGGEKYLLDVAEVLSQDHEVSLAITGSNHERHAADIRKAYQDFFQIDLSRVKVIGTPLGTSANWWQKIMWTAQFDSMYYLTDGSLFFSLASRNILHIQIPFTAPKTSLTDRLKLTNWRIKNANSSFTRHVVEKAWQVKIPFVHHPMIELPGVDVEVPKEKIILNVGRFFTQLHAKRQDILITMFKQMLDEQPDMLKGWKLVLIGGVEDKQYARELHELAEDLPIEFYHDLKRPELLHWYRRAAIYWHAAGYGINEATNPEKVEHFGISTVEAMAAGAAPVVIGKGGQVEVVGSTLKQWLWDKPDECRALTLELIAHPKVMAEVQEQAQTQATHFNRQIFTLTLHEMLTA